jgi:isoamylase
MLVREGSPVKLGATWDGRGTNFALFSANAERVELCLFDNQGRRELERVPLPERTEDVWHGYLPEILPGQLYGYRVYGPYQPEQGHRFNGNKLLIDPYAKKLAGRFVWSDAHFGYRTGSARADLSFDRRDNARGVPKCVVVDEAYTWGDDRPPAVPWDRTVIYEAHVKGATILREDVPAWQRGTYLGLGSPGFIAHLKKLGVTTLELLPVHAFADDRHLVERGLRNYWGYNTAGFFCPEPRYGAGDGPNALRIAIARLHQAGIEVILDVVYNHTAEGNQLGPTLSFRGIDNASYYWLKPGTPRYYDDFTGCGNALDLTHPRVLQMVLDSLRHWVECYHVDGFRFDLATTLGRRADGFDRNAAFFAAVRQDPVLSKVKLIAEPWDLGLGGYQVGNYPAGWREWNDSFRRTLRRFWRGEPNLIGELGARMTASADLFRRDGRAATTSVNFITAHDGFTLADLTSYAHKHNEANLEDNRDGSDENDSTNFGVEGATDDPAVLSARRQMRRNMLASLLLAQGVPMMLAGDEVSNSQGGNNNAYCQDNEIGWVDWSRAGDKDDDLTPLVSRLTELRRLYPQLSRRRWLDGSRGDGHFDILWIVPEGREMTEEDWNFFEARYLSFVLMPVDARGAPLFVAMNAAKTPIAAVLPAVQDWHSWTPVLCTASSPNVPTRAAKDRVKIPPCAIVVFAASMAQPHHPHRAESAHREHPAKSEPA